MAEPVTINVFTQKGGTGKTTTALELASHAVADGKNVLMIDFDPQGSLTDLLCDEIEDVATIYDVLTQGVSIADASLLIHCPVIYQGKQIDHYFDLVPANVTLAYAIEELSEDFTILQKAIAKAVAEKGYDFIVIDSSPMPHTSMAFNAFAASDYLVMPTGANRQSVKSLINTIDTVQAFSEHNLGAPKIAGVLICAMRNTVDCISWAAAVKDYCDQTGICLFDQAISLSTAITDAQTQHMPITFYNPFHSVNYQYEAAYNQLSDIIEGVEGVCDDEA